MNLYDALFRSAELDRIFSPDELVQSMLHFEAALARAEAAVGVIPESGAKAIVARCHPDSINVTALTADAALAGNLAIPLVKQLTAAVALDNKDAARHVHWGATSQDVIDTAMVLQLRRAFALMDHDLARLTSTLAALADAHRKTILVARTWMQHALPTTFGFVVAGWLDAILRHRRRVAELRPRLFALQFGGAAGTLAALGSRGSDVAKALAVELQLHLPALPWHTQRDRFAEAASALAVLTGSLAKIARDIALHSQTEIAELSEPHAEGRGGSSTLPHKRNPVTCAVVLAAARRVPPLAATMFAAMDQEDQRGLGGWHAEWETLPDLVCLAGGALHHLTEMLPGLQVDTARMTANLDLTRGLIFAEAVSMALGDRMGKMPAHMLVEAAANKARGSQRHLKEILLEETGWHGHLTSADFESLFDARNYLGRADEFVSRVLAEAREFSAPPGA